jgi:hypothetical protein
MIKAIHSRKTALTVKVKMIRWKTIDRHAADLTGANHPG